MDGTSDRIPAPVAPYVDAQRATPNRKRRARMVLLSGLLLAAAYTGIEYFRGLAWQSTDNAQVEGHIVNIATRVSGQVARVLVSDNQTVEQGQVLIELDPSDLDAKLLQARAEVAQAEAGLAAALAQREQAAHVVPGNLLQAQGELISTGYARGALNAVLRRARAELEIAQAHRDLAKATEGRARALFEDGAVSAAALDADQAAQRAATAEMERALASVENALASSQGAQGNLTSARGRLRAAEGGPAQLKAVDATVAAAAAILERARATLLAAELNRSYVQIRAPIDGIVSRVTAEPGQWVSPERPLFAMVDLHDLWVVANFKEDQIGQMRTGQRATVEIDAFSDITFQGRIESLSPASGSRFALLPPDNSSGNFVKVVQRVPVRVRLDDQRNHSLRPGMSAYVRAHVAGEP